MMECAGGAAGTRGMADKPKSMHDLLEEFKREEEACRKAGASVKSDIWRLAAGRVSEAIRNANETELVAKRGDRGAESVEARILVRVDRQADGSLTYGARGWSNAGRGDLAEDIDDGVINSGMFTEDARWTWVTARVPAPTPIAEVEGTVEDCEADQ